MAVEFPYGLQKNNIKTPKPGNNKFAGFWRFTHHLEKSCNSALIK